MIIADANSSNLEMIIQETPTNIVGETKPSTQSAEIIEYNGLLDRDNDSYLDSSVFVFIILALAALGCLFYISYKGIVKSIKQK